MLSIQVAKAAQPVIERPAGEDQEGIDDEGGAEVQVAMSAVEVAAAASATARTEAGEVPFDEDGPVWPDEAAESAMRSEVADRGDTLSSKAAREAAEAAAEAAAEKRNLPALDELIGRIPAEVRDTLEDLFRVKFVKVARVPKKALKE